MIIDTIEQYLEHAASAQPHVLNSKRKLKIPVPCADTLLVKRSLIVANNYNPNRVSDDKMQLLKQSILDNGFAFPVIVIYDNERELFVVIDGFHRYTITGADWLDLDYVPVAVLNHDISKRMMATWQFNKARGHHEVDIDAELIRALIEQGIGEDDIASHLGIDLDTVHRYKQVTGIAALFANTQYSMAWQMQEVEDEMVVR